jgi:hypothetical protein
VTVRSGGISIKRVFDHAIPDRFLSSRLTGTRLTSLNAGQCLVLISVPG